jgi:mono/diheme cytochrome c family protein
MKGISARNAVICALLAASVPAARAAEEPADEFRRHCALCHGLDARGGGPLAEAMKLAPTDLTRLAARNNGEFPAGRVADVIRNGGGVLGHGSTAMLAWGVYFAERRHPEIGKARISALVNYIKSLQQK